MKSDGNNNDFFSPNLILSLYHIFQCRFRASRNRLANVIPLSSPSSHRNKIAHVGKFSKHTKGPEKRSSVLMHNGKLPRLPPFHHHNDKGSSHPLQVLAPENSKTSKQRKQTTPSQCVPKACSLLVAHNQDKIIASRLTKTKLSDSSQESTQTAIFCEDNTPDLPPRTAPEKPVHPAEHQRTQVSLHQLNNEVKQYFQSRAAAQQRNTEEESSKSLDYNNYQLRHLHGRHDRAREYIWAGPGLQLPPGKPSTGA